MPVDQEPLDPLLTEAISTLRDSAPASDLWPQIAPRLTMRRPKGSLLMRWPSALAAGIAIAIVSAGGTMLFVQRHQPVTPAGTATSAAATTPAAFSAADQTLDQAIKDLEHSLAPTLAGLDATTRQGIEQSLASLNSAITDAHTRQAANPSDLRAERYLTSTLRKKLNVLRTVSTLTARRS